MTTRADAARVRAAVDEALASLARGEWGKRRADAERVNAAWIAEHQPAYFAERDEPARDGAPANDEGTALTHNPTPRPTPTRRGRDARPS